MKNRVLKFLFVLCLIIAGTLGAWAFSFRNMTLDIVHISDTHISVNRDDTSYKALGSSSVLLKDAVEQINQIKGLDFVLHSGDMVDSATPENYYEFFRVLEKLKYPILNAFGNHDLLYGTMTSDEVLSEIKQYNPNYRFDNTYYAFSPKTDYRIIVLNAVDSNIETANGRLSAEQLNFLDREIFENQDKIVVIVLHHPPVEPFIAQEHNLSNANEFNEILLKYKNPIVVLSGHYHATKIRHFGNLVYVSTPSMVTYPMAFRHIKIVNYKDRVQYTFEFIPTRLDDIKEQNRQSVISYGTLAGWEQDRNTTFTFYKRHPKSAKYKRNKIKNAAKSAKVKKSEVKKLTKQPKEKKEKVKKEKVKKEKVKKEKKERSFKLFKKKNKVETTRSEV